MNRCVSCEETITNPLCPGCLTKGIGQWLKEKNILLDVTNPSSGSMDPCIKCGDFIDLCTYCFTKHVYEELKIAKVSRKVLEEYTLFFHFDLERLGYYKKAKEEGVIV